MAQIGSRFSAKFWLMLAKGDIGEIGAKSHEEAIQTYSWLQICNHGLLGTTVAPASCPFGQDPPQYSKER